MLLQVVGQRLAAVEDLLELGVRDVATDHDGAVEQQGIAAFELGQLSEDVCHWPVQVDLVTVLMLGHAVLLRQEAARITVHLLDEQAVPGDLGLDVAVSRAGNRHAERAGCAVARQADDAYVMGKVLAAELGTNAEFLGGFLQFFFQFNVAESLAMIVAFGRQAVKFLGGREFNGLHHRVGRGAANNEGEVVGRAGCRAESLHLGDQIVKQFLRGEQRLGLLEEHGLVGGSATFCHKQELVGIAFCGVKVDLCRQVGAGVFFVIHVECDSLAVTQVLFCVGFEDPFGNVFSVIHTGPDLLSLLGDDGCGAGILAGRQLELGRNHGVAQECHGHTLVVTRGFRVRQDLGDLLVMLLAQQEGDVLHGGVGQDGQSFWAYPQDFLAGEVVNGDILLRTRNLVIIGFILGDR